MRYTVRLKVAALPLEIAKNLRGIRIVDQDVRRRDTVALMLPGPTT